MKLTLKEYIKSAQLGDIITNSEFPGLYFFVERICIYSDSLSTNSFFNLRVVTVESTQDFFGNVLFVFNKNKCKKHYFDSRFGGDIEVVSRARAVSELYANKIASRFSKQAHKLKQPQRTTADFICNHYASIKGSTPKIDGGEVIKQFSNDNQKFEKPLGDDFNMRYYLDVLKSCVHYYPGTSRVIQTGLKRLNALIKIWEWKEKNDGEFGVQEVMKAGTPKYFIYYQLEDKKLKIDVWCYCVFQTELPLFSSLKIADSALKELEQEYKIVFNVK